MVDTVGALALVKSVITRLETRRVVTEVVHSDDRDLTGMAAAVRTVVRAAAAVPAVIRMQIHTGFDPEVEPVNS